MKSIVTNGIKLSFTAEGTVEDASGAVALPFQLGTYAVRAEFPDGTVKLRVLRRGLALDQPDFPRVPDDVDNLRIKLVEQTETVYFER